MKFPISIDLGEAFNLAPDVARFVGLLIKAKSKKSDGGRTITDGEREELKEALEAIAGELAEDAQD